MRTWAGLVCLALLAGACGSDEPLAGPGEAEVLGIQVERDAEGVRTIDPAAAETEVVASPAEPTAVAPTPSATAAPTPPVTADPPSPSPSRAGPTAAPSPAPTSPRPQPEPEPEPEPSVATVALTTRDGHSYVAWAAEETTREDGSVETTWAEVSAAPPIVRGQPSEPLRVTLAAAGPDAEGTTRRVARCQGYLEADGDVAVAARGDVRVWIMVDGAPALDRVTAVDLLVAPGERHDVLLVDGVEVEATRHGHVTCAVSFVAR